MSRAHIDSLISFFETLSRARVAELSDHYAPDAYFKDPFNEVHRVEDIVAIFDHMFDQVDAPRFKIVHRLEQGDEAVLVWDMHFRFKGRTRAETIHGVTHVCFGTDGRVTRHRDYWDTGEELYQKIPVVGRLFRWLRRHGAAH